MQITNIKFHQAFDTLNRQILIGKLFNYCIRGLPLKWISGYLEEREQFASFENHNSAALPVTCGVSQGSILGPTLFAKYINNMLNASEKVRCILYCGGYN